VTGPNIVITIWMLISW